MSVVEKHASFISSKHYCVVSCCLAALVLIGQALATRVGPRPILSVPATLGPDSPEAPPPESSSLGASPPKGPPPYQAQERDTKDLVYGETAARSFVKALVWRITAAVITLVGVQTSDKCLGAKEVPVVHV